MDECWNGSDLGDAMKITDSTIMDGGKYKGRKMSDVPADYLLWLADNVTSARWFDVLEYVEANRSVLEKEVEDCG